MPQVTGEQVRDAMITANIQIVDVRDCSICGVMLQYIRVKDELYFNSNCDCTSFDTDVEPRGWSVLADWINRQETPEARNMLRARFGMEPE